MSAIFLFSSRTAEQSGEMSSYVTESLFGFVNDWKFPDGTETEIGNNQSFIIETLEIIIRKFAHFFIFAVLGFCIANTVRQAVHNKKNIFRISLCIGSFYAATDELHQYFVPGRACMWQDWLLDTAGVLFGIGAAFFTAWFINKISANMKNKKVKQSG